MQTKEILHDLKNEIKLTNATSNKKIDETTLLAKLLKSLREQHEVGLLAICKQINEMKIDDGVVMIGSDFDLSEIATNKKYYDKLKQFFNEFHLNLKLKEKEKEKIDDSEKVLSEMLDGKLTIK